MAKLGLEARMTIQELARCGVSGRVIARTLEVTEGTVCYHLRRQAAGVVDGRSKQELLAAGWHERIADWLSSCEKEDEPVNLALLHEWLVKESDYPGSAACVGRGCEASRVFDPHFLVEQSQFLPKVREKWAREIACSTPERTRLGQCFGSGILGRERPPSIEASERESWSHPREATISR